MPTLSASNRTQVAYKLEGASYPASWGVFPVAGNGNLVRITGETLDYTQGTEQSKELRSDRQVTDTITVSASSQGGFNFEMSYREFDWILEGIAQSTYRARRAGRSDPTDSPAPAQRAHPVPGS